MFDVLMASGPGFQLKTRWLTTSIVTHGLVIALAIVATRAALNAPPVTLPEAAMLVFVPKPPEPPPPEPRPVRPTQIVNLAAPPAQGFQTVVAPSDVPKVIPRVDLNQRPLDPRDFTGRGAEGGVADGVLGGTGPVTMDAIFEATTDVAGFEPAMVLVQPMPQYPTALASVGLEGRVTVEFVIDTTGKVERGSVKVIESTQPAFEAAARSAIVGSLFRPAHLRSVSVRQLTRQSVRFVATH
jgi:TonB family protein